MVNYYMVKSFRLLLKEMCTMNNEFQFCIYYKKFYLWVNY